MFVTATIHCVDQYDVGALTTLFRKVPTPTQLLSALLVLRRWSVEERRFLQETIGALTMPLYTQVAMLPSMAIRLGESNIMLTLQVSKLWEN